MQLVFKLPAVITLNKILVRVIKLEFKHKPVMLEECIQGLKINPDGIYVDGTLRRSRT
jgi:hypothetical protein